MYKNQAMLDIHLLLDCMSHLTLLPEYIVCLLLASHSSMVHDWFICPSALVVAVMLSLCCGSRHSLQKQAHCQMIDT
jgi:hypothetical protein